MVVKKVWLFPVTASLCGFTAIISGYVVGILSGHFPAILPFVSDVGATPPDGCLFSQFLNTGAFFTMLTCYIRHRQTVEYYGHRLQWETSRWRTTSLFLMWVGIAMGLGMTLVANFPESEVLVVHGIGALMTFVAGLIYCWGQVLIGHFMIPRMASTAVNIFRLLLCLIATLAFILHEVAMVFSPFGPKDHTGAIYRIKWWKPDSPYFTNHVVATGSEWIMVSSVLLIIFSLAAELRFAYAHAPRVVFRRTSTDHPEYPIQISNNGQPSSDCFRIVAFDVIQGVVIGLPIVSKKTRAPPRLLWLQIRPLMSALSLVRRYSEVLFHVNRYRILIVDAALQCCLFYYGVTSFNLLGQPHPRWPVVLSVFTFIHFEMTLSMTLMEPCDHRIKARAAILILDVLYTFLRIGVWALLVFAMIEPSHAPLQEFDVDELTWELFFIFTLSTACTIYIVGKTPYLRDPFSREQL